MSALLIAALVLGAGLFAWAIVLAYRSQPPACDQVSEHTRIRLFAAHYYGKHGSWHVREERRSAK